VSGSSRNGERTLAQRAGGRTILPSVTEPVQVEVPSAAAAFVLLGDLAEFGCSDLVPVADGHWQVSFDDPGRRLDDMLSAIEHCLGTWDIPSATVRIDGRARTLSAPARNPATTE
jgi:hypothetical protein